MFIQIEKMLINTDNITYITEVKMGEVTKSNFFMSDSSTISTTK